MQALCEVMDPSTRVGGCGQRQQQPQPMGWQAYHWNSEREKQSSHILTEGRRQLKDFQAITFPLLELEIFEGPKDKINH